MIYLQQPDVPSDPSLIDEIRRRNNSLTIQLTREPRVIVGLDGRPNHTVEASDVDRIRSRTGLLNNWALNGLTASLLSVFGHPTAPHQDVANRCALLNTYDLHRVRYNASDSTLWKHLSPTQYWDKGL